MCNLIICSPNLFFSSSLLAKAYSQVFLSLSCSREYFWANQRWTGSPFDVAVPKAFPWKGQTQRLCYTFGHLSWVIKLHELPIVISSTFKYEGCNASFIFCASLAYFYLFKASLPSPSFTENVTLKFSLLNELNALLNIRTTNTIIK